MLRKLARRMLARGLPRRAEAFIVHVLLGLRPVAGAEDPPAPAPTPTPPAPPAPTPPADPPPGQFSQADVDRIVQDRLARDRKDRPSDDELKQLRDRDAKLKQIEDGEKSDLQKAQDALDAEKQRAAELETGKTEAEKARDQTLIRSAVVAAAAKQGAVDADQVYQLLPKDQVTIGDDGQVTDPEKPVKDFLDANKHLVGDGQPRRPGPGDGGPRNPTDPQDLEQQIREAESKGDWNKVAQLNALKLGRAGQNT